MAHKQQLVLVVEGTNALGPAWSTILRGYLQNIIRCFYWSAFNRGVSTLFFPAMGLVIYKTCASRGMIKNTGWTTSLSTFLGWLSCITFSDTSTAFGEVAMAEALQMLYDPSACSVLTEVHKHCLFVCASDPHPLETLGEGNWGESVQKDYLANVESLAKCFSNLPMTLSVISPNRLPKWKTIYNAGKRDSESTDKELEVKHSNFTILLAKNFREARSALDLPLEDLVYIPEVGLADTTHTSLVSQLLGVPVPRPFAPNPKSSDAVSWTSTVGNIPNANKELDDTISNHVGSIFSISPTHQNAVYSQSRCVKIWEGTLCGPVQDRGGVLSRLEAYACSSASALVAGDWPSRMDIVRTPAKKYLNELKYDGSAEYLGFRALDPHWFLTRLHRRKLCAIIPLPTKILVISTCKEPGCLSGVLIGGARYSHLPPFFRQQKHQLQQS